MTPHDEGSWNEWSTHVLAELKRQNEWLSSIQHTMNRINVDIAVLKVKSGIWGAVGGVLVGLAALLFTLLTGKH